MALDEDVQRIQLNRIKRKLKREGAKIVQPSWSRSDARSALIDILSDDQEMSNQVFNLTIIRYDELLDWVIDRLLNPDHYKDRQRWQL